MGVRIQDVSEDIAETLGLASAAGALVTDLPEGPAMDAGIEPGDVILSFDGRTVADTRELVTIVGNSDVGATVPVVVWRDGAEQVIDVTLGRREDAEGAAQVVEAEPTGPVIAEVLGLTLSEMTDELREGLGLPAGTAGLVVTAVDADSEASGKGMREGDVITEAGQQAVTTIVELNERVTAAQEAGRRSILLLVRRAGEPRFVALPIDGE